ncbi:MAG TPA: isoaspartyl peptidase/L-asparaginase [Anaeromyxobacter sp.]|nr:isoaspartyl peptidase/L-asparaginase [Anaeromyxobacter sp.]
MRDSLLAVAVHGGAGERPASPAPDLGGVRLAAEAAWAILAGGGSALDAVEAAVRLLEDDPAYNAGTGACLNVEGDAELDASIMDGATLACGAVAVVRDVKNPVTLARRVMDRSRHVLLAGPGASAFARHVGIPPYPGTLLVTDAQRARWEARRAGAPVAAEPKGTVGAVARDAQGHLAAATSTGGIAMKLPGRVGDSAVIGAGTYADDTLGAVSCTGEGERMIQLALARQAAELAARVGAREAARAAIRLLGERVNGRGGLILLGPSGDPSFALNTATMPRAYSSGGAILVAHGPEPAA